MGKTISFGLSEKEIEKAIKTLKVHRKEMESKINELIQVLVDKGVDIARVEVETLGAFDTGNLEESIEGFFNPNTGIGIIKTDVPYAFYVEFGTGINGKGSPHPEANKEGWSYDVNNHGVDGWWYIDKKGKRRWTQGMPSRPFMYNTLIKLQEELPQIVREVFKK